MAFLDLKTIIPDHDVRTFARAGSANRSGQAKAGFIVGKLSGSVRQKSKVVAKTRLIPTAFDKCQGLRCIAQCEGLRVGGVQLAKSRKFNPTPAKPEDAHGKTFHGPWWLIDN